MIDLTDSFENIRQYVIDVHNEITPSNTVVYADSIDTTQLQIRLIDKSYYYTIPENAEIKVFIDDIEVNPLDVALVNRYKGLFTVSLSSELFTTLNKQYEISIKLYSAETDSSIGGAEMVTLKTTLFYTTSYDDLVQSLKTYRFNNTATAFPTNPSPDWIDFI